MSQTVTFSANQIRAIDWFATSKFERSPPTQAMLADEIGVRRETISRWKRDPEFGKAIVARAREFLGDDLPEIYGALRREATGGSYQHIKLSLELTGEYVERKEISAEITTKGYTTVSPDDWTDADED